MRKQDFDPHEMVDPKTDKVFAVRTYKQHLNLKKKGFERYTPPRESYTDVVERRMKDGGY